MSTHSIPFSSILKTENHAKLFSSCGIFSTGLQNKLETSVVDEPSGVEPLKFYCICSIIVSNCFKHILFPKLHITTYKQHNYTKK